MKEINNSTRHSEIEDLAKLKYEERYEQMTNPKTRKQAVRIATSEAERGMTHINEKMLFRLSLFNLLTESEPDKVTFLDICELTDYNFNEIANYYRVYPSFIMSTLGMLMESNSEIKEKLSRKR